MLFARRIKPGIARRVREALWPRSGFRRAAKYVGYRVLRMPGTPHGISGGIAWGAAVSFTPFIGMHLALAALGAWLTRCSVIAAVVGTAVGNPWTFPFILAWIYQCGVWVLGAESIAEGSALHGLGALFSATWHLLGGYVEWAVGLKPASDLPGLPASYLGDVARMVLWPMVVGSVLNATVVWVAFYAAFKYLVVGYRRARRHARTARGPAGPLEDGDVPNI